MTIRGSTNKDSVELRRHLAFRDFLRAHPEAAAGYAALKRQLAERCGADREGYTAGKSAFIRSVDAGAERIK